MAQGDGFLYNNFFEQLLLKKFDLDADTLKVTLHTGYTPNVDTHALWADSGVSSTEYGTADGYTAGGKTLANTVVAQDNTNDRATLDADNPVWTALGPLSPATPSHALLWDDTTSGDMLIGGWELGSTATSGVDYELDFATAGVLIAGNA